MLTVRGLFRSVRLMFYVGGRRSGIRQVKKCAAFARRANPYCGKDHFASCATPSGPDAQCSTDVHCYAIDAPSGNRELPATLS